MLSHGMKQQMLQFLNSFNCLVAGGLRKNSNRYITHISYGIDNVNNGGSRLKFILYNLAKFSIAFI